MIMDNNIVAVVSQPRGGPQREQRRGRAQLPSDPPLLKVFFDGGWA